MFFELIFNKIRTIKNLLQVTKKRITIKLTIR